MKIYNKIIYDKDDNIIFEETYYSIGGGFIVEDCDFERLTMTRR